MANRHGPVTRLALRILGGISSLLLPIDDILPLEIRRVHIAEIFGSNFLFGVATASLLVRRTEALVPRCRSASSEGRSPAATFKPSRTPDLARRQ